MMLIREPKMKSDDKAVKRFERQSKRGVEWPNPRYTVTMHKWNKVSTEKKSWPKQHNQVTWRRKITVETPDGQTHSAKFETYNSYFTAYKNGHSAWDGEVWLPSQNAHIVEYDHPLWHDSWRAIWDDDYGTREGVTIAILQTACEFIRRLEKGEEE
jgi:hypothetical protein